MKQELKEKKRLIRQGLQKFNQLKKEIKDMDYIICKEHREPDIIKLED